jgi:IS1 family transposase/transposase-like protein
MRVLLVLTAALVILALLSGIGRRTQSRRPQRRWWVWRLRPRTPDDCPRCRHAADLLERSDPLAVPPWRQGPSRRGAPRRISTEGYACRQPACPYYGITDRDIHALVADGRYGRTGHIQRFRGQACHHTVTARYGAALYRLKTPPARIGEVLAVLAEGLDIGAAVRVFGHGEATITRWRDRAAGHADRLHLHFLRSLQLPHLQLDEIRVRLRLRRRVTWLWLALDPATKLIPAVALGPRTQHTAHDLVHRLRATLSPTCVPVVTTDGLRHYFYALTAHFGRWVTAGRRRRWQVDPACSTARSTNSTAVGAWRASGDERCAGGAGGCVWPCAGWAGPAWCRPPSSSGSTSPRARAWRP